MDELIRRKKLSDGQQQTALNYGFVPDNPIMVDSEESEKEYLSMLRTDNVQTMTWKKVGELCLPILHGVENVTVNGYQLYTGEKSYKTLYMCHEGNNTGYCPYGLSLSKKAEPVRERSTVPTKPENTATAGGTTVTKPAVVSATSKPSVNVPDKKPDIIVDRRINPPANKRCPVCNAWISESDTFCTVCRSYTKSTAPVHEFKDNTKAHSPWKVFLLVIAALLLFCMFILPGINEHPKENKAKATATPKVTAIPTATPRPVAVTNGRIIITPSYECICPFTVDTKSTFSYADEYYYVYLKYKGESRKSKDIREKKSGGLGQLGESDIAFCVKGGQSVKVDVPVGIYELYYASGTTFYGSKYLFGSNTVCTKANTDFEFYTDGQYVNGHTVTLYKVNNGNMTTREIDESQFPTK